MLNAAWKLHSTAHATQWAPCEDYNPNRAKFFSVTQEKEPQTDEAHKKNMSEHSRNRNVLLQSAT